MGCLGLPQALVDLAFGFDPIADRVAAAESAALGAKVRRLRDHLPALIVA